VISISNMARPHIDDLKGRLASIGLEQYHNSLVSSGFDSWESTLGVSEDNLVTLGFKRGHRRRLQRQIATDSGYPLHEPLPHVGNSVHDNAIRISPPVRGMSDNGQEQWYPKEYRRSSPTNTVEPMQNRIPDRSHSTIDINEWLFAETTHAVDRTWREMDQEEGNARGCQDEDVIGNKQKTQKYSGSKREAHQNRSEPAARSKNANA
jgi:hypothetical protein